MWRQALVGVACSALLACGARPSSPAPRARPCFTVRSDAELRAKDAKKLLDELSSQIQLSPEDQALKTPKSIADIRKIIRRDTVYLFGAAADYARTLDTLDARVEEATLELLLGESELIGSQVLSAQDAWLGVDLRIARANLATEGAAPTTERGRMLAQLIRVVEEGNKIGDALGAVAPGHLARGADLVRRLQSEAPTDPRTIALVAEYHRARGEWTEFDRAMAAVEGLEKGSSRLCYLRAMEQLERYRRPRAGAEKMRECRKQFSRVVRIHAGLVVMATNADQALAELERLREISPDHYLVMLLEPTLAADRELTRIQQPASVPPPASTSEGSTDAH